MGGSRRRARAAASRPPGASSSSAPTGRERAPDQGQVGVKLVAGDRFVMRTSGGGGLGPALDRDARAVRDDIAAGKVTPRAPPATTGRRVTTDGWVLGVDVGGTFTDVVLADTARCADKLPTTPEDPVASSMAASPVLATGRRAADVTRRARHDARDQRDPPAEGRADRVRRTPKDSPTSCASVARRGVEEDRYDLFFTTPTPPVDPPPHVRGAERIDSRRRGHAHALATPRSRSSAAPPANPTGVACLPPELVRQPRPRAGRSS